MGRISKNQEEQIKRRITMLAEEKMVASEIAEALGISTVTVYRYRDRYNIPMKEASRGRKPNGDRSGQRFDDKVRFLASAGATVSDVAAKLQVPVAVVKAVARKYGIPIEGLN